jgi:hypothetical protein
MLDSDDDYPSEWEDELLALTEEIANEEQIPIELAYKYATQLLPVLIRYSINWNLEAYFGFR